MSHLGCKSLLGKKDEWICKTPAALLTCEAFKKQGKLKACPDPNKQNLEQLAEQAMEALGCKNLLGKVGEPLCSKEEGIAACNALHAAGYLKKCHP